MYSRRVRIATCLAALLAAPMTTGMLVGCSGGGDTTETTIAVRPSATMTDAGCTYDGAAAPAKGVAIDVRNGSTRDGDFAIARMAAGATRGDLDVWLEKLRRHLPSAMPGKDMPRPPYRTAGVTSVVSGAISELPTYGLSPGRYVLLCFQGRGARTLVALDVATSFRIGA
jgi:hypothetical protein